MAGLRGARRPRLSAEERSRVLPGRPPAFSPPGWVGSFPLPRSLLSPTACPRLSGLPAVQLWLVHPLGRRRHLSPHPEDIAEPGGQAEQPAGSS